MSGLFRLLLVFLAFPLISIVVKYWRWCARLDEEAELQGEDI
jgi:hypothetical protein